MTSVSIPVHDVRVKCDSIKFCKEFVESRAPKYVFGRNEYGDSLARCVHIDGFVDEFTDQLEHLGKPIVRTSAIPPNALVVSVVIGRPFVAEKKLIDHGIRFLDYFSFQANACVRTKPIKFWDSFKQDFSENRHEYEAVYDALADEESKRVFTRLINFRLSSNLDYMRGFRDTQHRQYFEDFLALQVSDESFIDVGGYDGRTSVEFVRRCPQYTQIHVFEPEQSNFAVTRKTLSDFGRVKVHPFGLGDKRDTLRFNASGSTSMLDDNGDSVIMVERLDDLIEEPFTYLKMDIEGAERSALAGMQQAIAKFHPRLAVCVYHRYDDFWQIPKQVLNIRSDYRLYLRHYTEGVDETVMFFQPSR